MLQKEIYVQSMSVIAYSRSKDCIFRQKAERRRDTLICVVSGKLEVKTKENTYTAVPGELLYIPASLASVTTFLEDCNRFVNFTCSCNQPITDSITLFSGNGIIHALVKDAELHCLANSGSPLYFLSLFYRILWELEKENSMAPDPKYRKLLPVLRRIEQHPEENVKVSEYASALFLCETGFRRLFKEYTGKSPIEYRNSIRLRRVEDLILSGETVANAATAMGFKSVSFYYRCLKNGK